MKKIEMITGVFEANANGYGFVKTEGDDRNKRDIYISEKNMNGAFHMDTVIVMPVKSSMGPDRPEGKIVKIVSHGITNVVGILKKRHGLNYVIPDNQRILYDIQVPEELTHGALHNQKVVVTITEFGNGRGRTKGEITEIIGFMRDPGTDILCIAKSHDLPIEFPEEVNEEVKRINAFVSPEEWEGRLDLRDVFTVTIDGEDAKDLDDAISLHKDQEGHYHLGVHIADVSHYVTEGSALDQEALKRGTSVYLPDRVIPMLPRKLSNGICSLNAGEDRLAFSCLMVFDEKGKQLSHEIRETVINVNRRLSYTGVYRDLQTGDSDILPFEKLMEELAAILRRKRYARGAVDFDFPEAKIILNEKGRVEKIVPYERNTATRIIEDFMLAANETVAEDAFWQELPFLYRVHENPDEKKMEKLAMLLSGFGYSIHLSQGDIYPKELAKILEKIEGTEEEPMLSRMILRSMKQARYSEVHGSHFGLASEYYTHFTSPIRRYPDLCIHRILKENLKKGISGSRELFYQNVLPDIAKDTSRLERRADECEREADKLKKAQYMRRFIGQNFEGNISGVTKFGFYVELPNTIEGLVHVSTLDDDYYQYIEDRMMLVGEMSGRTFSLGQKVEIIVSQVDEPTGLIDFRLAYHSKRR